MRIKLICEIMETYDQTLKSRRLPAPIIISNFVSGNPTKYETYLVEFINQSKWFSSRFSQKFVEPESEAHGECDCYSGDYGLDFKLIASQSELHAASCMSAGKVELCKGVVATVSPKKIGSMGAYILHKLIRFRSIDDLKHIAENDCTPEDEQDIKAFLKVLKKKKHLFLFHPYEMYFDAKYSKEQGAEQITNAINSDFRNAIQFRNEIVRNYDTYLAFVHLEYLVITKYEKDSFQVIDFVELKKSKTFTNLRKYTF